MDWKNPTRGEYEQIRNDAIYRRKRLLAALARAHRPDQKDRITEELGRYTPMPTLPALYVYELYEPDGSYMGTVRSREEVRELRSTGISFRVRRARDIHAGQRALPPEFRPYLKGAWR